MTQKGKSPIEQAVRAAAALLAIEEWNLEAQREERRRMERAIDMGRPTCSSIFIRDLPRLEPFSLKED